MKKISEKLIVFLLLLCLLIPQLSFGLIEKSRNEKSSNLVFISDAHAFVDNGNNIDTISQEQLENLVAVERFKNWLNLSQEKWGAFDFIGSCGDMADGSLSILKTGFTEKYWTLANRLIEEIEDSGIGIRVYTAGNHEQKQGRYGSDETVSEDTPSYLQYAKKLVTRIGIPNSFAKALKEDNSINYRVFCFGVDPDGTNYNSYGSDRRYIFLEKDIDRLNKYLLEIKKEFGTSMPVFVMAHYPLHSTSLRTFVNSEKLIDVLNHYPNVIYLWGHNHSDVNKSDNSGNPLENHYGKVFIDSFTDINGVHPINFTYASAGCMSGTEYSEGSGAVTSKALIVNVGPGLNPKISMFYTDESGNALDDPVYLNRHIVYDANGGINAPAAASFYSGDTNIKITELIPEKEGHKFIGWSTDEYASAADSEYNPSSLYTDDSSIVLFAVWQKETYSVNLDLNGGVGLSVTNLVKTYSEDLSLKDYITRQEGYYFAGWSKTRYLDDTSNPSILVDSGGSLKTEGDTTLYAVWKSEDIKNIKVSVISFLYFIKAVRIEASGTVTHGESLDSIKDTSTFFLKLFKVGKFYIRLEEGGSEKYYCYDIDGTLKLVNRN